MSSGFGLAMYDAACRAVAQARSTDEVKDIPDQRLSVAKKSGWISGKLCDLSKQ